MHMNAHTRSSSHQLLGEVLSVPLTKWPWRPKIGAAGSPWAGPSCSSVTLTAAGWHGNNEAISQRRGDAAYRTVQGPACGDEAARSVDKRNLSLQRNMRIFNFGQSVLHDDYDSCFLIFKGKPFKNQNSSWAQKNSSDYNIVIVHFTANPRGF